MTDLERAIKARNEWNDLTNGLIDIANYARAVRVVSFPMNSTEADLAGVVEDQARALHRASAALRIALNKKVHDLTPPPGPHANCLIKCGPDCED